jgi:hypothetical protein
MKKALLLIGLSIGFCAGLYVGIHQKDAWHGVDESVVEKYAGEAGRRPLPSLINTDRGDLLLFLFLIAGVLGGFLGGYCFREMFPSKKSKRLNPCI